MGVNDRADQTALVARSSAGKSHYIKTLIEERRPPRLLIWSPLETTDKYARFGALIRHDMVKLVTKLQANVNDDFSVVFEPDRTDPKRLIVHFDQVCALVIALAKRRPVLFIAEEVSQVTRPGWSPPRWQLISTEGRHHGVASIATTQRPALVDKTYLAMATMVRCGALQSKGDKTAMADLLDVPLADIRALLPGQFIVKDAYTGALTHEGVVIADLPAARPKRTRAAK